MLRLWPTGYLSTVQYAWVPKKRILGACVRKSVQFRVEVRLDRQH